jgi:predicted nucleotidyltransferase
MALRNLPIRVDEDKVAECCRVRGIRRLRLFGSVLREDFDPTRSDVDVLAEFHPEAVRTPVGSSSCTASNWGRYLGTR